MPRFWLSSFAAMAPLFFSSAAGSDVAGGVVWYVDAAAGGANTGTSWVDAFNDLQDALGIAQAGDEIWVAAGTYTPDRGTGQRSATFQLVNGVGLYGGFAGWETQRQQRDPVVNQTILSGDLARNDGPRDCAKYGNCCLDHSPDVGCDDPACEALVCEVEPRCCDPYGYPWGWNHYCADIAQWECCDLGNWNSCENAYFVVNASGNNASTIFDGFTVRGAYVSHARDGWAHFSAGLLCQNGRPTIRNCLFTHNISCGVYGNDDSSLTLSNCSFVENFGIGVISWQSDPVVLGCRFAWNTSGMLSTGDPDIRDSVFESNTWGGLGTDGGARITRCTFVDNGSTGFNSGSGYPIVTDCAFLYNRKIAMGCTLGHASVDYCVFIGNRHGALGVSFGAATVTNSLFAGNVNPDTSGALGCTEGALTIRNCTLAGNAAGWISRGALSLNDATATVSNCILWANTNSDGSYESAQIHLRGDARLDINHSLVQGWTGAFGGIGNFGKDPLFVDPDGADNIPGTEDDDLRLLPNSPAMNRGDPGFTPNLGETDLDGNPRLQGCRVDMGAYESDVLQVLGDFDGNSRFDLSDFAGFEICLGAEISNPSWLEACVCAFDFNQSQTLDLIDFAAFRKSLTGP